MLPPSAAVNAVFARALVVAVLLTGAAGGETVVGGVGTEICANWIVARRDHLIEFVWNDRDVSENNLETYIRYLRQKVDQPGMPRLIRTVRGFGYSLRNSVS